MISYIFEDPQVWHTPCNCILYFQQIDAPTHKSSDICDGSTIHFSFVQANYKGLFFRSQCFGFPDICIFKLKFRIVSVEGLIEIIESFITHDVRFNEPQI